MSIQNNPMANPANRKQGMSIYTVMLLLSVIFMLIAVIAMYVEFRRYAPEYWNTSSARPAPAMVIFLP